MWKPWQDSLIHNCGMRYLLAGSTSRIHLWYHLANRHHDVEAVAGFIYQQEAWKPWQDSLFHNCGMRYLWQEVPAGSMEVTTCDVTGKKLNTKTVLSFSMLRMA